MRTSISLGHERSIVNIKMIKGWYDDVSIMNPVINSHRRKFNDGGFWFPLAAKGSRVMAEKEAIHVYQVVTNTKTQFTVIVAFDYNGDYVPPMFLLLGERLRDNDLSEFPDATYAATKNGWMNSETFVEFLFFV